MQLAHILGICLLLARPQARVMPIVPAAVLEVIPPNEPLPDRVPQQDATTPVDRKTNPDQSATPPKASTVAAPPCPSNPNPDLPAMKECKPQAPTKEKLRKPRHTHKAVASPDTSPSKTVVRNGSTTEPILDLTAGLSKQQASHELESTNQLLGTVDANLKKISGRDLSASQQDTVNQIKSYQEQARAAANSGDLKRAYNLAVKANLLSAELAGH